MIVTEKQINQQKTRVGVLNLVSDACRYYSYSASENFDLKSEIEMLQKIQSNNVETGLILNLFVAAKKRLELLK